MITKQQLGLGLISVGVFIAVALFANDLLGTSEFGGIGRIQRNYYIAAAVITTFGLTLLPLGNRAA